MDGMRYYGRDGKAIPLEEWAQLLEDPDGRRVAKTQVTTPDGAHLLVSTVLIGLDMNYTGVGLPIIFETMTFSQDAADDTDERWADIETRRYATEREALTGHAEIVAWLTDFGYAPHVDPHAQEVMEALREARASVELKSSHFTFPPGTFRFPPEEGQ